MTTRRYYHDSYAWEFEATVTETGGGPEAPWAVLDATCFYPTSGGQPHDTGRLGPARVTDVSIRPADGAIVHHLSASIPAGPVTGAVDGGRRFDHMQQHSGQHILSQAVLRVAGAPTIGFHLGAELVSIDVETHELPELRLADAVDLANQIITTDLPVRAWFPTPAELEQLELRKLPEVEGPVRVVGIGDFDFSACGGTHVARTGEIGLIAALRTERLKRGTRIEFLAGHRARADYARKQAILRELGSRLTCSAAEVPAAVERLTESLEEARRTLKQHAERVLDDEAARLLTSSPGSGGARMVVRSWPGRPIDEVKGLALRLTTGPGVVVLFGVPGQRTQLLFARSENLDLDLKPAFDQALAALGGGKGGGGRILQGAAGGTDAAGLDAALAAAAAVAGAGRR